MKLVESILQFDKKEITEDQIKLHVRHYVKIAEQGLQLVNEKKYSEALNCLKEIRKTMKEEYKYYSRSKVQPVMWDNDLYSKYYHFIQDAFVKQISPNSFRTLGSNLYDVMDYGRYYFREYLT